jgi:predicted metal-dependent peptidase
MSSKSIMKDEQNKKLMTQEYSAKEKNDAVEKLITARVGLLLRQPFFGNLATRLELIDASDWLPTLATDGRKFYYNVGFVKTLSAKQMEFGFGHEVLHNVFDHLTRRESRNPKIFNYACDFAVNQILIDERIGERIDQVQICYDRKYTGKSSEEIYDELMKNVKEMSVDEFLEQLGDLLDEHIDWEDGQGDGDQDGEGEGKDGKGRPKYSKEELKKIRDELKEAMVAASQAAGAGRVPLGVQRFLKDLTEPKMDWRQLLRMNIQSMIRSNYSFMRPSRKGWHTGAILPGMMNDETIDVCIAIDMSGSIGDAQAKDFITEVKGIMDEYVDYNIKLWCFDTEVYNLASFTADNGNDLMTYEVKGGGGTDFDANYNFMKEHGIEPKKFIMFTDGYPCGSWGDEDYCDTLFIIHGSEEIKSPFGQYAHYK